MFKIGDTGLYRGGTSYLVKSINDNVQYPIEVVGDDGIYTSHTEQGIWITGRISGFDLMPPEESQEQDYLVYGNRLHSLAELAANSARNNPDLTIILDPETMTLLFQAKE